MEPLSEMLSDSGLDSTASISGDPSQIQKLLSWEDFTYAINTSKPSQQIEFESVTTPRARNEYGGYAALKRRVQQTILWPITNPETFKRMGVRPPMGLLLYGPSGKEDDLNTSRCRSMTHSTTTVSTILICYSDPRMRQNDARSGIGFRIQHELYPGERP